MFRVEGNDRDQIRRLLTTPATWAVVGLGNDRTRPAYGVAQWLASTLGMTIVPIHPMAGRVEGITGYRSLADVPDDVRIDVVDCFVNSERVGAVVDQAIAQRDRLGIGAVWLQLGVRDDDAVRRARAAGLVAVQDTCPKIEWPLL